MTYLNIMRSVLVAAFVMLLSPVYAATMPNSATTAPLAVGSVNPPLQNQTSNQTLLSDATSTSLSHSASALSLLEQMSQAITNKNYELVFINGSNVGFETLLYRHGVANKQSISQLIYMEGPKRVIMQKGDSVSYFEQHAQSYSLHAKHIIDELPAIFYSNFDELQQYYDFSVVGYGRAANKSAILVRMLDKQHERYTQLIWIDQQSHLPLRIDYIDQNGQIIEQFKVAQEHVFSTLPDTLKQIDTEKFPPLLPIVKNVPIVIPSWSATWLPDGFNRRSCNSESSSATALQPSVESCYFSDGVYSFSINVSSNTQHNANIQNLIKGMRLIHIETEDGHQVVFIGNLPINTAEKIIEGLDFTH